MKIKKILLLSTTLILLFSFAIYSQDATTDNKKDKKFKYDREKEKRFQLGFGISVSSPNFTTMHQNNERRDAIDNGGDYSYPGMSDKQAENLQELDIWMQKAILTSYMFRSMEYNIQMRILWKTLIAESDITVLPTDYMDNKKTNIQQSFMIGIRYPYFIMPYILFGPNFTVGFNPDAYNSIKGNWYAKGNAFYNSINFSPGLILKTGVDLKFKKISLGFYYQYKIKSFDEFNYWKDQYDNGGLSQQDVIKKALGEQSRFGLSMNWYIF